MKLVDLKRKIIFNCITSFIFALGAMGVIWYFSSDKKSQDVEIAAINTQTQQIKDRSAEYISKSAETRKYKEIWKNIPENQKNLDGFKIDDVNKLLNKLSEKYYISTPSIKISVPENLKDGIFDRKSIYLTYSTVNIVFNALDDVKAISFLSEFVNNLIGYVIITNLDVKRTKKYTQTDLVDISTGKNSGFIAVKLDFTWYVYRLKEEKKDEQKSDSNKKFSPSTNKQPSSSLVPTNSSDSSSSTANTTTNP
jgi:hypothetical protein